MKIKSLIYLVLLVAVLLSIKFLFFPSQQNDAGKAGKAGNNKMSTNVTAYIVRPLPLESTLNASGTVIANEEVELRPELPGKLMSIHFKEGSLVQKGALLAKINDAELQAQLRKQQLQLKLSREREERLKGLLAISGVSQEEFDAAAVQSQSISADIDYTKAQIARAEIRAPFTGKIGLRLKSVGAYVSNNDVLAKMQQTDMLKIDFTVPERYAPQLKLESEISFTIDSDPKLRKARIMAIEPKIDQQTRNVTVRAIYNNSDFNVFPGSFAKIEMAADKQSDALLIPTEAVIPELKGKKVFVAQGGKSIPISIKIGTRNDVFVEVLQGLKSGDTVIVTGIMSLKPEAPVNIVGFKN